MAAAAGLARMFAAPAAPEMAPINALLGMPYVPAAIVVPNPGGPTNLIPRLPVLMMVIRPLMPQVPPAVGLFETPQHVTSHNLRNICEYVNSIQAPPRNIPGSIPLCAVLPWNFYPGHPWPAPPAPALATWAAASSAFLNGNGFGPATFVAMQNIFIPITITRPAGNNHTVLIVISPLARTIDYLDSGTPPPEREIVGHFFHLVAVHLGRDFDPRDWRHRLAGSVKETPGNTDSAIHVGANAMSIAFGYTLNHGATPNMLNRRRRMVSEVLNRGFAAAPGSPFYYGVINGPPNRQAATVNGVRPFNRLTQTAALNHLPREALGRWHANGRYNGWIKARLKEHCRTHIRYKGLLSWGGPASRTVHDYREQIEMRDIP